ncbi:sensor histidine kinase NtrY-like [Sabulicella glaciei]|uniref:histidine kinase n=1 Tax=Sabulicella glaciei TaxID=2984948 RepID=A0ABT3NT98_9PROT|nr:PAS domain-containing sensor histidine kinase [Roseococcus sp. MDT2-1-1]MCW8085381.1 PAS domain-containing sensor histidine kinase [Roseococcus sp. MDT2-1-1]
MTAKPRVPLLRRAADMLLGRGVTLGLAIGALFMGIATFVLLSDGSPLGPTRPGQIVGIVLVNLAVILLLVASLAGRLVRVWVERRRGAAGSRLHTRLVLLFSVVAVVPALLLGGFAALFFNLGIQAWFSDRVRTALEASLSASRAYLEEHQNNIRADALAMANDLNRATVLLPDQSLAFARVVATQAGIRGLTEAVVFEPILGRVVAHAGMSANFVLQPPPTWAIETAQGGDVAVVTGDEEGRVRAVVALTASSGLMMMIGRPVDASVLEHMQRTEAAVTAYQALDRNREGLQVTFVMIFAIGALLVLLAAVLIGLLLANQLARPISRLIMAAERVRGGDLTVRVEEGDADDEVGSLSRAFNRMTNQLAAQRSELMEAYRQIEERQNFTEAVLGGVSAGIVGLDPDKRVNLPNRSASQLLGLDLEQETGRPMGEVVPEFAPLLAGKGGTQEVRIGPPSERRTLLARLSPELDGAGFVLTFDDISALLAAQRQAAWADVARRIAHEIKNPLTPIQLSAERLKRRYLKQIQDDPETFKACTDTIVRQVGDIGRMVDEFSAFARMPQPVMRQEEIGRLVREALVLQQNARPEIIFETSLPAQEVHVLCDRRLINQALTNLLHNAADSIAMRAQAEASEDGAPPSPMGHIRVALEMAHGMLCLSVEDDGIGLPEGEERDRLTEPYVTHKTKGTGLGLAIVKKIMEDHGGRIALRDAPPGPDGRRGARAELLLPSRITEPGMMEPANGA